MIIYKYINKHNVKMSAFAINQIVTHSDDLNIRLKVIAINPYKIASSYSCSCERGEALFQNGQSYMFIPNTESKFNSSKLRAL